MWYEILKLLRNNAKESMSKTAEALGIPKGTYASYEYGNREPNIEMISKIAKHFNVSTDYILYGSKDELQKDALTQLVEDKSLSILEEELLREYMELPYAARQTFMQFIDKAAKAARLRVAKTARVRRTQTTQNSNRRRAPTRITTKTKSSYQHFKPQKISNSN